MRVVVETGDRPTVTVTNDRFGLGERERAPSEPTRERREARLVCGRAESGRRRRRRRRVSARAPSARRARRETRANAPRTSRHGPERSVTNEPVLVFPQLFSPSLFSMRIPPFDTSVREGTNRANENVAFVISASASFGAPIFFSARLVFVFVVVRVASSSSSFAPSFAVSVRETARRGPMGGLPPKPPRTNVSDGGAGVAGRPAGGRRGRRRGPSFPSFSKPSPSIASPLAALSRSPRALASSAEVAAWRRTPAASARAAARRMASGSSSTRRAFGATNAPRSAATRTARVFSTTYARIFRTPLGLRALVYARVDAAQVALELAPGARGEDRPRVLTPGGSLTKTPSRARRRARSASSRRRRRRSLGETKRAFPASVSS